MIEKIGLYQDEDSKWRVRWFERYSSYTKNCELHSKTFDKKEDARVFQGNLVHRKSLGLPNDSMIEDVMLRGLEGENYEWSVVNNTYGEPISMCPKCGTDVIGAPCRGDYFVFECGCRTEHRRPFLDFPTRERSKNIELEELREDKVWREKNEEISWKLKEKRREQIANSTHFVYIIRCGDTSYYKIGIARNTNVRMTELQTCNPFLLQVAREIEFPTKKDALNAEKWLKKKHNESCVRGEWFYVCDLNVFDKQIKSVSVKLLNAGETTNKEKLL